MKRTLIILWIAMLGFHVQADSTENIDRTKFIEDSKCLAKEKLDFKDVIEFSLEDKMDAAEKNPKLKCFALCLLEFGKIMDGCSVVYDKKSDVLSGDEKDEFVKAMEKCKDSTKGTDRCECGYQLMKCITDNEKKG